MPSRRVTTRALETTRALALEREALDLAQQGYTVRRIADAQGCSPSAAHERIGRALDRLAPVTEAETYRRLLDDQLAAQIELTIAATRIAAEAGNVEAVLKGTASFARLADRRAKLLGLDAPVRIDATLTDRTQAEIEQLVEALAGNDPAHA